MESKPLKWEMAENAWGRVRFDRRNYSGYWLDDEFHLGFPDNPELTLRERLVIAHWAQDFTPEAMSPAQKQLIADNPPSVSLFQKEWNVNRAEMETPHMRELWNSLSEEEQELVRSPCIPPSTSKTRYPLTVAQLAAVTGASEDEIHTWADEGLIPAFRQKDDRRFYSAAVIRTFVLRRGAAQKT